MNNLTGLDEAEAVRKGTSGVPQTLMPFVGASGRSVKIVCRDELEPRMDCTCNLSVNLEAVQSDDDSVLCPC